MKSLRLSILSLLFSTTALPAFGANITWTGATNDEWTTGTNWAGAVVPGGADTALLNNSINAVIRSAAANVTSVTLGSLAATNGVLTIQNGGTITSTGDSFVGFAANGTGTLTVTGANSIMTSNGQMRVGNSGTGTLNILSGGAVNSTLIGVIGYSAGSTGEATVNGAGSVLTAGTDFYVGLSGAATLNVQNGGKLSNGTASIIGSNNTSIGTATVNGAGSEWTTGTFLRVGGAGTGTLNIQNGGKVSAVGASEIARNVGSIGAMTVDGTGSTLTITDEFRVGTNGNGTMSIQSGGAVSSTGIFYIGSGATSTSSVTVTGAGSTLSSSTQLRIGNSGTGTLNIQNGGTATSTTASYIANSVGSTGTATVDGAGSSWGIGDILYVGNSGTGTLTVRNSGAVTSNNELRVGNSGTGTLNIQSGGTVSSTSLAYIGVNAASAGTVTVTGAGSTLSSSTQLRVGNSGNGTLNIQNGGVVSSTAGNFIAYNAGSTSTATVDGVGSALTSAGELRVGNFGNGTLIVQNGGTVSSTGATSVSASAGSTSAMTVDGVGSLLTATGGVRVGNGGNGTLNIQNGGHVTSTAAGHIGSAAGSVGMVTVNGANSIFSNSNQLLIGNDGAGTLTVQNGGSVSAVGNVVIANGATSTGTLNIGAASGNAAVAAGSVSAAGVTFGAGTGEIVFNHTNTGYTFTPGITGNGTLRFLSGETILSGNSSAFTGDVDVTDGILRVNGQMGATVTTTVANGARFGGSGSIGDLILQNGSTLAPGNSIGTTSVANAIFNAGMIYEVEVNSSGQSDLLDASGTVTINGGIVRVIPFPNYAIGTPYTIINAGGGIIGGPFDTLEVPSYVTGQLNYGANSVSVTLSPQAALMLNLARTRNQIAVAGASTGTGAGGNAGLSALYFQPDEASARRALDLLSGEIHASLSAAQIRDQRQLREVVLTRRADVKQVAGEGTLWARSFGGMAGTDSDNSNGTASGKEHGGGVIIGAEKALSNAHIGAAIGHSFGDLDVDGRASDAQSKNYHVMTYGGMESQEGHRLDGGASWTWHEIETERDIALTNFSDTSKADYSAQTAQVFAAFSHPFERGSTSIRPYLEGAYIYHETKKFHEQGMAALDGKSTGKHIGFATLGVNMAHDIALTDARSLTLSGGLGWQRTLGDTNVRQDLSFSGAPGTGFSVTGAALGRDALIANAGVAFDAGAGINVSVEYNGSLAKNSNAHTLSGRAGIEF